jgi:hypothetical protein
VNEGENCIKSRKLNANPEKGTKDKTNAIGRNRKKPTYKSFPLKGK